MKGDVIMPILNKDWGKLADIIYSDDATCLDNFHNDEMDHDFNCNSLLREATSAMDQFLEDLGFDIPDENHDNQEEMTAFIAIEIWKAKRVLSVLSKVKSLKT